MTLLGLTDAVPSRKLVRPPGALSEEQFMQTCMRCGACTQVCPIRTIKRADLTYGFRNIGTPNLVGHCMIFKDLQNLRRIQDVEDPDLANSNRQFAREWKMNVRDKGQQEKCFECVKICPSGALRDIATDQVRIGTAVVNRDLCKAWHTYSCTHDCQECCPFDAIDLAYGPIVNETKCVGCNLCNLVCVSETIPRAIGVPS
jgi:Fe-S-cluster-containing hydrogenase component 2